MPKHIISLTGANKVTWTCECGKKWYYDQLDQANAHAKEHGGEPAKLVDITPNTKLLENLRGF